MRILAGIKCIVISFDDIKDLENTVKNLTGLFEWAGCNEVEPPYLYAVYDDSISEERIQKLLDQLKEIKDERDE